MSDKLTPRITVQLSTHNRLTLLKLVLQQLFVQTLHKEEYEIVLVDDGSTDGTEEWVRSIEVPIQFTYIRQEKDCLAVARNKGIRAAKGEYILFIDDDVLPHEDLLIEHLRFHDKYPKSVVKGWVNHVDTLEIPKDPKFTSQDISTAFFWTSNVSVKREYLFTAGLFDEAFREYGWEDLELGYRLRKLGLKCRFNKKAVAFHYKRKLVAKDMPSLLKQAESKGRTAIIYVQKHHNMRVQLATGVHWPRLLLHRVLNAGGYFRKICEKIVSGTNGKQLHGMPMWCAHQIIKCVYFDTVQQHIKEIS